MNCTNCGTPTLAEHEFCRSCGTPLSPHKPRGFRPQVWGFALLTLMFGGLMVAMTGKMLDLRWLTFTGVFICMGGMFLMAAFAMYRQSRPKKRRSQRSTLPVSLDNAGTTNKLLPLGENDFIPSVTESTTNLLATPSAVITPSKHSPDLTR